MNEHEVTSTVVTRKKKISAESRMTAKALLLEMFPEMRGAGQLIIHFGPGRNPFWVEVQERWDSASQQIIVDRVA
jgi:hypothetical protein